jgi:hypothetical protein
MYLIKIFIYHIKYNYVILEVIILLEIVHRYSGIFLVKSEYLNTISCSITILRLIMRCTDNALEDNATKIYLISGINNIHMDKPLSINLCNRILIAIFLAHLYEH